MSPIMDMRGVRFKISAIHTAAQQKMYEEKFAETAAKLGLTQQSGQMRPEVKVLTLDEAIDYFLKLREIQNAIEERERSQSTPTETD